MNLELRWYLLNLKIKFKKKIVWVIRVSSDKLKGRF